MIYIKCLQNSQSLFVINMGKYLAPMKMEQISTTLNNLKPLTWTMTAR